MRWSDAGIRSKHPGQIKIKNTINEHQGRETEILTNIKKVIVYRAWGGSCLPSCLQFILLIGSPAFRGRAGDIPLKINFNLKYAIFVFHLQSQPAGQVVSQWLEAKGCSRWLVLKFLSLDACSPQASSLESFLLSGHSKERHTRYTFRFANLTSLILKHNKTSKNTRSSENKLYSNDEIFSYITHL